MPRDGNSSDVAPLANQIYYCPMVFTTLKVVNGQVGQFTAKPATVLSHTTDFSVGCYCQHEDLCHHSILKQLLVENGAKVE